MQYVREAESAQTPPPSIANAWKRYLVAVRNAGPEEYEEIEEQAWTDLLDELFRLGRALDAPSPDSGHSVFGR